MLVLPNSFLKKSSFIVKMVPIRPSFFMGCSCGKKYTQDESPELCGNSSDMLVEEQGRGVAGQRRLSVLFFTVEWEISALAVS